MLERGTNAVIRQVPARRPTFAHRGRADVNLSANIRKALSKERQGDLAAIHCGGICTANNQHAAGLLDNPNCPWCRGPR